MDTRQSPDRLNTFLTQYETYVKEVLQPTQREIVTVLDPSHWEK